MHPSLLVPLVFLGYMAFFCLCYWLAERPESMRRFLKRMHRERWAAQQPSKRERANKARARKAYRV